VLDAFKNRVEEFRVIPGSGGIFEVRDLEGGRLIYSKEKTGRFPEEGEVRGLLGAEAKA